jgi:TonB-linked SusC/RagA family outer membrane protein
VGGQTVTQDFVLASNPLKLNEVVVTGAGTSTIRERLASTINTVDSSTIRRATEPQNIVSALAGKAPNVEVRTQSGEPGSSASIKIRGNASLSGTNQPLFVVDGQPIDNQTVTTDQSPGSFPGTASTVTQNRAADINPNDIESIEILKSAAAAAIYGARAANGVVLITTKRGRSGPTRISLSSTNTFDDVVKTMPMQTKYGQGLDGEPWVCGGLDCVADGLHNGAWGSVLTSGTPVYDHGAEIFHTGVTSDNYLSVSGGNDRTTFYGSGGYTAQRGVIVGPNNKYNRATVRVKASQQTLSTLTLGGNLSYIDTRGGYVQKGSNTSGLLLGALRTPPEFNNQYYLDSISGLQRSYRFPSPSSASLTAGRGYDNPFFILNNNGSRSEVGRSIGNVTADWNPLDWLNVNYTLGADYYNDWRLESFPFTSSNYPSGRVIRADFNNLEIDHNLVAKATHDWGDNIQGTLTLGQNLNSRRNRSTINRGDGLNAPGPFELTNVLTIIPNEVRSLQHVESYFTQAELDLYNQLYLTVGLRNDGFSTFGASKRRHNFPKATAAWNFTNAMGVTDQKGLLSYGKLRLAYGETGKEPDVYETVTAFNLTNTFGSGYLDLLNQSQSGQGAISTDLTLGNSNLRPEVSRELEYGVDLGFFDQMADLGLTLYNKRSSDVILAAPVSAAATGSIFQLKNAGSLRNRGVELTLNVRPITTKNVAWELGMNYGHNKNTVLDLAGADFITYNNEGFSGAIGSATVGQSIGVLRGSDFARCGRGLSIDIDGDGTLDDIDALCAQTPDGNGTFAKNALFIGSDGLPVVDPTDRVIADPNPKHTFGFNTSVRLYNKLSLSTQFDVRKGFSVWDGTRGILLRFGTLGETLVRERTGTFGKDWMTDVYPDVAGPGAGTVAFSTPADWQNWFLGEGGGFGSTTVQFVEDGSFVKWRELGLTYTLDQSWLKGRTGFSSADIRIAGRNLHTWTNYKGLDPETNVGGAEWLTQGVDYFNSPETRSFVISLTLNR